MDYSIYVKQLRERLIQQIRGLSTAISDTQLDKVIGQAIGQGYMNPQPTTAYSAYLSREMSKQISTVLNELITQTLNNIGSTPITFGQNLPAGAGANLQKSIIQSIQTLHAQYAAIIQSAWSTAAAMPLPVSPIWARGGGGGVPQLPSGYIPLGLPAGQQQTFSVPTGQPQRWSIPGQRLLPAPQNLPRVVGVTPDGYNIIEGGPGQPTGYTMAGGGGFPRLPAPSGAETLGVGTPYVYKPTPAEIAAEEAIAAAEARAMFERTLNQASGINRGIPTTPTDEGGSTAAQSAAASRLYNAEWEAAFQENTARNFANNPRYQQVWKRMQEQDILRGTQFAQPGNITGISAENNRNIGYVTSKYQDPNTGMNMSNRTFFNPQTGQVVEDLSNRFANLSQRIMRNTKEFIGWTAAVTLVYLPLQKLGLLMQDTIDQEAKLADVAIVMGINQEKVNRVFDDSAKVARQTGQTLTGVIEGYASAAQATAGYADENERLTVTNKLLYDSIVLAKISTLSQAEATDVLVAALYQEGMSLDQGSILLDKWQATARAANVNVGALATTVAIVGQAALNAGLDLEHLNALTAVVAQAGVTSPKETGNAIRGIISGYTTQGSINKLREFGVSVTDVNGNMRDLLDVYSQIAAMSQAGMIDKSQTNAIAMALTGGNRGLSRVMATLIGTGQISDLVAAQTGGKEVGQAEKAIQIELETTQSALNNMGTAFASLARSMATTGGILPMFKNLLSLLTGAVDAFTKLSEVTGTATLPMIAMGLALKSVFSTGGQLGIQASIANMAGGLAGNLAGGNQTMPGMIANQRAMQGVMNNPNAIRWGTGIGMGVAATALTAWGSAASGDTEKAKADAIGGVIGGAFGGLLMGPMGIAIGATIGTAFAEAAKSGMDRGFNLENLLNPQNTPPTSTELTRENQAKRTRELLNPSYVTPPLGPDINKIINDKTLDKTSMLQQGMQELYKYTPETGQGTVIPFVLQDLASQTIITDRIKKEFPEAYAALFDAYNKKLKEESQVAVKSPFVTRQGDISKTISDSISAQLDQARADLQKDYYSPTKGLSRAQYKEKLDLLGPGSNIVSGISSGLYRGSGDLGEISNYDFGKIDPTIKTWADASKYMIDLLMTLSSEQLGEILSITSDMTDIEKAINDAKASGKTTITEGTGTEAIEVPIADYVKRLQDLQTELPQVIQSKQAQAALANAKPPSISGMEFPTMGILQKSIAGADKEIANILSSIEDESERTAQKAAWEVEKTMVKVEDNWVQVVGRPGEFIQQSLDKVLKESEKFTPNLGFQDFSQVTPEQYAQAQKEYPKLLAQMKEKFGPLGWEANETGAIVKLDPQQQAAFYMQFDKKDWNLMNELLSQIAKNTTPTGMYNLPAGAEFMVPYKAAETAWTTQQGIKGAGGMREGVMIAPEGPTSVEGTLPPTKTIGLPYKSVRPPIANEWQPIPTTIGELPAWQELAKLFTPSGANINYQNTPELYKTYGQSGISSLTVPTVKSQIDLTSNVNVTLLLDGRVLAQVVATQMGTTLANSGPAYGQTLGNVFSP